MSDGFLSKWIVEQAGEIFCLRDMTKAVNVKVFYHRDQKIFHEQPWLLLEAMISGLSA